MSGERLCGSCGKPRSEHIGKFCRLPPVIFSLAPSEPSAEPPAEEIIEPAEINCVPGKTVGRIIGRFERSAEPDAAKAAQARVERGERIIEGLSRISEPLSCFPWAGEFCGSCEGCKRLYDAVLGKRPTPSAEPVAAGDGARRLIAEVIPPTPGQEYEIAKALLVGTAEIVEADRARDYECHDIQYGIDDARAVRTVLARIAALEAERDALRKALEQIARNSFGATAVAIATLAEARGQGGATT